jgi:hypothetical protein
VAHSTGRTAAPSQRGQNRWGNQNRRATLQRPQAACKEPARLPAAPPVPTSKDRWPHSICSQRSVVPHLEVCLGQPLIVSLCSKQIPACPLDDVIVHAIDVSGNPAVLEIQVKRTISFTLSDAVFRKVVGQIAETSRRPDFWSGGVEMAIATSRGSRKIDGPYQDVLALARQIGDASTFAAQLKLAGTANDDIRAFVKTFQSHLRDEGSPYDDATTWQLLRRLQILTFDFAAPGSVSEDLARERLARTLHPDDASHVDALWGNLIDLAINVAGQPLTRGKSYQSVGPTRTYRSY